MRIFSEFGEMMDEVERELFEMGINNQPQTMQDLQVGNDSSYLTKELPGYSYALSGRALKDTSIVELLGKVSDEERANIQRYIFAEIQDRLSIEHQNPGRSWMFREHVWKKFLHEGKFSYTYNERMKSQLGRIVDELKRNPGTRQAVITLYDKHKDLKNLGGVARIPCSMHYQFLLREYNQIKRLYLFYTMRSCDYYTHFPIDVALAVLMLRAVADEVDAIPYVFTHFIGSLHAYKKDFEGRKIF